jgi:hypothetical protein
LRNKRGLHLLPFSRSVATCGLQATEERSIEDILAELELESKEKLVPFEDVECSPPSVRRRVSYEVYVWSTCERIAQSALKLCQIPGIGVKALEVAPEQAALSYYNARLSCGESLPLVLIKSSFHIIALLLLRR